MAKDINNNTMADSEKYAKEMMKLGVCRIAKRMGFKEVESAALDALTDATANLIESIGHTYVKFAEYTFSSDADSSTCLQHSLDQVFKEHSLNQKGDIAQNVKTLLEKVESSEEYTEHDILPIPAELEHQQGTNTPLNSTAQQSTDTRSSRDVRSKAEQKYRASVLRNVPKFLHPSLPRTFTFKSTAVNATSSNSRLAKQLAEVESGGGVSARMSLSDANEKEDNASKKEDYFTAKSKLRASLNQLWGSTITLNAQRDRAAFEDRKHNLLQQRQQASGSMGMPKSGGMGMPRGGGMGMPISRRRSNSVDGTPSGRKRSSSVDVPSFTEGSAEKRTRMSEPANPSSMSATAARTIVTPTKASASLDQHIAPVDSSKIEPEEPPTPLLSEHKR